VLVFGPFDFQAFDPGRSRWRRLASAPTAVDGAGLVVWTGREMIDWGGGCCGDAFSAGWAYNPATNTWRKLPTSPLAPSSGPNGVWTGRELVIFESGLSPDGKPYPRSFARAAAYNPTTNRWRRIAASPGYRLGERAFWDGHEVLLVAVRIPQIGRPPVSGKLLFAYSPTTNRWRQLAPMPSGRSQFAAVWDGKRLLVWGGTTTAANSPQNPPTGTAYDPRTNRWSPLPRATLRPRLGPTAVWTGRTMIVWGGWTIGTRYFTDGAAFTPTAP
jgi:N-acetylneuraminic acid mutarotase